LLLVPKLNALFVEIASLSLAKTATMEVQTAIRHSGQALALHNAVDLGVATASSKATKNATAAHPMAIVFAHLCARSFRLQGKFAGTIFLKHLKIATMATFKVATVALTFAISNGAAMES
jgi:hypothetical protein